MPAKKKRAGSTRTFSISVDKGTARFLKQEAKRAFDGNVSALIAELAREAERMAALDRLLAGSKVDEEAYVAFVAEMEGRKPAKRKRRAA